MCKFVASKIIKIDGSVFTNWHNPMFYTACMFVYCVEKVSQWARVTHKVGATGRGNVIFPPQVLRLVRAVSRKGKLTVTSAAIKAREGDIFLMVNVAARCIQFPRWSYSAADDYCWVWPSDSIPAHRELLVQI